ncbi:TWiK family of potassium channels protein 7 [Bradysia coprophila]|uniref:TWiK family of potassium channels protein 7 n=1 Tax=Bradysia coprophila TaxID=38358 RepID=UPI00187DC966|nr:TWiK family of potassium channels protein 7 [Bradysia coprophila]XP_037030016.1 TWiK family of potassium channels protein 7 [Bradysia coprophila]
MNNKPPLQVSAYNLPSPPSPPMCFPSPKNNKRDNNVGLCGCQRAPKSHCISAFGVIVLVLAYTAMGSILFMSLEGEDEDNKTVETAVAASKPYPRSDLANAEIRTKTVDRLWSITEDLNILYKENWTRLAAHEVQQFQDSLLRAVKTSKIQQTGVQPTIKPHKWSYASAFLYSLTLITTIGYGGISPRTQWGRIAALVYALFGIPIVLLYLSAMGEGLSSAMRCIFRKIRTCGDGSNKTIPSENGGNGGSEKRPHEFHAKFSSSSSNYYHSPSVPISICVMILICYVTLGAVLFHKIQHWGVLESLYFCFTSLGTIGFGDLAPKGNLSQYAASAYILVGMAVVAMCFSLIQTELIMWLRKFGVQDQLASPTEDVALVTVSVTPKS